jgi:hypothetical protein
MPISDPTGYEEGHFRRVYDHLIKPACVNAGYSCVRADDVNATNYIVIDILHRIVSSDLVVCDLSGRNPNVMYELGIRQAFNLPVVLLKDRKTERVFDIQGFRTIDYDERLRVDTVNGDIERVCSAISSTMLPDAHDVNSLVKLLGVPKADLSRTSEVSADTALILQALSELSSRMNRFELRGDVERDGISPVRETLSTIREMLSARKFILPSGDPASLGEQVRSYPGGDVLGVLVAVKPNIVIIRDSQGELLSISSDSDIYENLSTIPF